MTTPFEERRDWIRATAEKEYRSVEWLNPNSLGEIPSLPDWMVAAVVRKVFGMLMIQEYNEDGQRVTRPDRKVLATVTSTAAQISEHLQVGVARGNQGATEIPPIEQECVSAAVMLQRSTTPPNYDEMSDEQRVDMELQMALQLVTFWVNQVLVVRLKELRLEERTRG